MVRFPLIFADSARRKSGSWHREGAAFSGLTETFRRRIGAMPADLRSFLDDLRAAGEIIEIHKPVDIRHIAALVDKSPKALLFHKVIGYWMPVISGLTNSRGRIAISMKCDYSETEGKLRHALDHPIPPVRIEGGAEREVFVEGDEVDLFNLPVPVCSVFDGGPMITAGVTL